MVDHNLTPERLDKLLDKLYSLGLKTKFKLAIDHTLRIGLGIEDYPLSPALTTRAFELTAEAISDRLALDFAEELLNQFRIVAEEEERKNGPRRGRASMPMSGEGPENTGGNPSAGGNGPGTNPSAGRNNAGANPNGNRRPPQTRQEVYRDLRNFFENNRSQFQFKGEALESMAKAVEARGREIQDDLGLSDDQLLGLAAVSLFDIVFLCDDSGSMNAGERIPTLIKTLQSVADWATRLEPKGISIRFLNYKKDQDGSFDNLNRLEQIRDVCHHIKFNGQTELGAAVRKKILNRRLLEVQRVGSSRPLIVAVITDGEPTDKDPDCFRNTVLEFKTTLGEGSVVFILFQVGRAEDAKEFLDNMANDEDLENNLYCSKEPLDEMVDILSRLLDDNLTGDAHSYKKHLLVEFIKAVRRDHD